MSRKATPKPESTRTTGVDLENPFTEHFQMICALITHLGAHETWKSRTPSQIASSLNMPIKDVGSVLDQFPCFFRKSTNTNPHTKEALYTVHLRYARRKGNKKDPDYSPPLTPDEIGSLINTLTKMVDIENQQSMLSAQLQNQGEQFRADLEAQEKRFEEERSQTSKRTMITIGMSLLVAFISALSAMAVAFISKK